MSPENLTPVDKAKLKKVLTTLGPGEKEIAEVVPKLQKSKDLEPLQPNMLK